MLSLGCVLSISRREARNLARRRILLHVSPARRRCLVSFPITQTRHSNRRIHRRHCLRYFSSVSAADDDSDTENKSGDDNVDDGSDVDALRAAIERLKSLEPPAEGVDNAPGNRREENRIKDDPKRGILNIMKSSPLGPSSLYVPHSSKHPLDLKGSELDSDNAGASSEVDVPRPAIERLIVSDTSSPVFSKPPLAAEKNMMESEKYGSSPLSEKNPLSLTSPLHMKKKELDSHGSGESIGVDALRAGIESFDVPSNTQSPVSSDTPEGIKKNMLAVSSAANDNDQATSKPSLSDLLQTDIFTQSWAESNREESVSLVSRAGLSRGNSENTVHSVGNLRVELQNDPPVTRSSPLSESGPSPFPISMFDETPTSWEEANSSEILSQSQQPPSQAEIEYEKNLAQTNELLDLISKTDDDASTLQLMDFDNVMKQWARFNSEIDSTKNDGSVVNTYGAGYSSDSSSLKEKASEQCMRLLEALENNYNCVLHHALPPSMAFGGDLPQTKHSQLMPNAASYNFALHTLAHSDKGQHVAQQAYSILKHMLERCQKYLDLIESDDNDMDLVKLPPPPFEPTIITFNSVAHAIAKSGSIDAGHLAEEMFAKMYQWNDLCEERKARHDEGAEDAGNSANFYSSERLTCFYHGVLPNERTLACVLDAWANAKTIQQNSFSPERAEAILDSAIKRWCAYAQSVTGKIGGVVIQDDLHEPSDEGEESLSLMKHGDIAEESIDEDLLNAEYDDSSSPQLSVSLAATNPALRPNTVAFNTCINAWATSISSRGQEGALRAQELLSRLEALSESGELDLPEEQYESPDADPLPKPNVRSYSMVMNAWANVAKLEIGTGENAASRCEDILNKMEERGSVDASVRPNLVAYVTSITAWARTNDVDYAASRAENILNRMIDLYYHVDQTQLPSLDGDVENASHDAPFNAVITAYARSSDPYAAERALAVLQRLEASPILPTTTSYNAVMDVCAKHGEPERALEIFTRMQEMSILRDSTSYDTVLNAFARDEKAGSAERAYEFLCQLEKERSSGKSNFSPSSFSYATVINSFARASGKSYGGIHTVKKAREIYTKLIDQIRDGAIYVDVNPFPNSCFLNCCANVRGTESEKKEALIMAITAFEDMKKKPDVFGHPNQYTFGTMMKACARLSSDVAEKHRLMESLFVQACNKGFLSKAVLGQFLRHTPSHLNMKVILSLGGTKRAIPQSWHRGVPRKHWPAPLNNEERQY